MKRAINNIYEYTVGDYKRENFVNSSIEVPHCALHISSCNYFNLFIICYTANMSKGIRRNFVSHYKYSLFTNFIIWFRIF